MKSTSILQTRMILIKSMRCWIQILKGKLASNPSLIMRVCPTQGHQDTKSDALPTRKPIRLKKTKTGEMFGVVVPRFLLQIRIVDFTRMLRGLMGFLTGRYVWELVCIHCTHPLSFYY